MIHFVSLAPALLTLLTAVAAQKITTQDAIFNSRPDIHFFERPLDGFCMKNGVCENSDKVVCNQPRGASVVGRCVEKARLLTELGAPCSSEIDRCDARLNLSCRWAAHLGRMACQQRYDTLSDIAGPVRCTPGSKLSACPGPRQFYPSECRTRRAIPGLTFFDTRGRDTDTALCLPRPRSLPAGASCDVGLGDGVRCADGTSCRVVPGVSGRPNSFSKFPSRAAVFCVRTLQKGAVCAAADKFSALCADGLTCKDGKCVPGDGAAVRDTHANVLAGCKKLPCAPGFRCDKRTQMCQRAQRAALKRGALCRGDDECAAGAACRTAWNASGYTRCRAPGPVGSFCLSDAWCRKGLRCPRVFTNGREAQERRCFDPKPRAMTRLGQRCNPGRQGASTRCRSAFMWVSFGGIVERPLRCLPTKTGRGHRCQVAARPFGWCGRSVRCGDSRFTCKGIYCFPKQTGL